MTEQVKRYGMCGFGDGMVEREDGEFYHVDDYDALQSRLDAAEAEVNQRYTVAEHERLVATGQELNRSYIARLERQLAERDSLLREALRSVRFHRGMGQRHAETVGDLHVRIDALLSDSAEVNDE